MHKQWGWGLLIFCIYAGLSVIALRHPGPDQQKEEGWRWVPVDGATCADGSSTGFALNKTDRSKRLLIYFQGGGACWDRPSCYGLVPGRRKVINLRYDEKKFTREKDRFIKGRPFLVRDNPNNPFQDYSFVFLPYCTGDLHAGNKVVSYGQRETYHVGYNNVRLFLSQIEREFPDVTYVFLLGTSAGGCGAWYNWDQVHEVFKSRRVDVLIDSCPMFAKDKLREGLERTWRDQWNLNETLPQDCSQCRNDLDALYDYYAEKYHNSRLGLASYLDLDKAVMTIFAGLFKAGDQRKFQCGLDTLLKQKFADRQNFHYFLFPGEGHIVSKVLKPERTEKETQWGASFAAWIRHMMEEESWGNRAPRRLGNSCASPDSAAEQ